MSTTRYVLSIIGGGTNLLLSVHTTAYDANALCDYFNLADSNNLWGFYSAQDFDHITSQSQPQWALVNMTGDDVIQLVVGDSQQADELCNLVNTEDTKDTWKVFKVDSSEWLAEGLTLPPMITISAEISGFDKLAIASKRLGGVQVVPPVIVEPIIGQEVICPKGLGRLRKVSTGRHEGVYYTVDTYVDNEGLTYSAINCTLVPIVGVKNY